MAAIPLEGCCSSGAQIYCIELPAVLSRLCKATINYSRCSKRRYHLAIRRISGAYSQRVAGFRGLPRVTFHITYRKPYDPSYFRELSSARSPHPAHRAAKRCMLAKLSPTSQTTRVTDGIELSIVMPCLNEAATLAGCIDKARIGIERSGVRGEISLSCKAVSTTCPCSPMVSIECLRKGCAC
jgi:hypothetical protein